MFAAWAIRRPGKRDLNYADIFRLWRKVMGLSFTELKSLLHGLIGFGVTPFHQDFTIDKESLRRNAAHLAHHCDIVVALGNNGEIFSLSLEEQKLVGRAVVEEVGKRKPVLVGTGSVSYTH